MLGGVRAMFVSGLVLHLALTALGALLLLASAGPASPLWAALLLFHPTLAIYSRTIMADATAGTGPVAGGAGRLDLGVALTLAAIGAGPWRSAWRPRCAHHHAALALDGRRRRVPAPRGGPMPGATPRLCVLSAGSGLPAALIVLYNLAVYHAPLEPFTAGRGYFSAAFLVPHAAFYTTALLAIWPAMLLAPVLDRSPLRWLIRGLCGVFLAVPAALLLPRPRLGDWLFEYGRGRGPAAAPGGLAALDRGLCRDARRLDRPARCAACSAIARTWTERNRAWHAPELLAAIGLAVRASPAPPERAARGAQRGGRERPRRVALDRLRRSR